MPAGAPLRIVFAGTPDFAVPSLDAVHAGADLIAAYTQPDRPAGRGRRARESAVKRRALEIQVPLFQPDSLRESAAQAALREIEPDLMVVVAYGLILPPAVLDIPRLGCINVHASILPRWRGAAPIQRAILAGDSETGVTLMQVSPALDAGDILLVRRCPIEARDTAGSLHDRLAGLGAEALGALLPRLAAGPVRALPQDEAAAVYAPKIDKAEARIDWKRPAGEIERHIRAFNPVPVAYAALDGERVRIWLARSIAGGGRCYGRPGDILGAGGDGIDVAAGSGVVRITTLQWPGRRVQSAAEAANGRALEGHRFS